MKRGNRPNITGPAGYLAAAMFAATPALAQERDGKALDPVAGAQTDRTAPLFPGTKATGAKKARIKETTPMPKGAKDSLATPIVCKTARELVGFDAAPFPVVFNLTVPDTNKPFFSGDTGSRFHDAPRGGKLYEKDHYEDNRSLVVVPPRFDPNKPAVLVLFFHGNLATLSRDVVCRQRVIEQVEHSKLNAVFVAPQLAVNALDSSPGLFYEKGFLDRYLDEAAIHLATASGGRLSEGAAAKLPVVLVAYSGGYLATAYSLPQQSGTRREIVGVILLDALFGEEPKFTTWIKATHRKAFFVTAYSASSAGLNGQLAAALSKDDIKPLLHTLPSSLEAGDIVFLPALTSGHNDFVTSAWAPDPITRVLRLINLKQTPEIQDRSKEPGDEAVSR